MNICYDIARLPKDAEIPKLTGEFCPDRLIKPWSDFDEARIDHFPWVQDYKPTCAARVGWNERGLHVLLYACESEIRCEVNQTGGAVCGDSCLEFFLSPNAASRKYINIEVNPNAVMHIGLGDSRYNRQVLDAVPDGFNPSHARYNGKWWAVNYTVPADFIRQHFGIILAGGLRMRGNFYSCGDLARVHYGMFKPYNLPEPDYHRPELFADMFLRARI